METHGAETLYYAVNSLMLVIWAEDEEAQLDKAHWMVQTATCQMIWKQLECQLLNGNPLMCVLKGNLYLVDLELTKVDQARLKALVEAYISQCDCGGWSIDLLRLECPS
jgi:hypothetical protein